MPYELNSVFACLPQVERGVPKVLGGDPKGVNFLYTNGRSVIIRNIENPAIADVYTEHAHFTSVAKYAPSGFYIASGDTSGKVRIWDTTQKEHLLKYEYQPFAGRIKDIAWTEDSKRIAVVGEGRENFGAVFLWDSGSSVGEIVGHSKVINSVDIKQTRPYRLVTGSDDNNAAFLQGPPFKFQFTTSDHSRFVNSVRFSPNGNFFATAGADGQIFIYDGASGQKVSSLGGEKAHDGGIYAVCWSPDSTQLMSASGDRTVRLWDVAAGRATTTFTMGAEVNDQQLGCLWQGQHLLSIGLSGYIHYLDRNNPSKPIRVIKGHSKSIQSLTTHTGSGSPTIYSGSYDGHINYWDAKTGVNDGFSGHGHTNQVSKLVVEPKSNTLVSCSMDDTLRFTDLNKKLYSPGEAVKLDSQPKCVAVGPGGITVATCIEQVVLLKDKKRGIGLENPGYEPEVVAIHRDGVTVAVGGQDSKVHLYKVQGNTLADAGVEPLSVHGAVMDVAFSPDGTFLAVGDANKVVSIFSVADGYKLENSYYGHHAKVVCLAWSPDSHHLASSGMDMMVYVWTIGQMDNKVRMAGLLRAGLPAARRALCRRVLSVPNVRGPLLALPAAQPSPVGVHLRGLSTLLSGLRIGTAVSPSTQASIGALRVLGQNKVTGTLGQPPRRSLIYFSKGRGKRKTVKAVVKRFLRLDCGLWLRRQAGCKKRLWKKRKPRIRRLRQHVLCNKWQSKLLDKMVTDFWKRRKWYENDPYQLYHERTNFRA